MQLSLQMSQLIEETDNCNCLREPMENKGKQMENERKQKETKGNKGKHLAIQETPKSSGPDLKKTILNKS